MQPFVLKCSIAAIEAAGFQTEALAKDTAYWDKAKATDLMNTWITSVGLDKIEAILANNDDMALGAIEALKAHGYNTGDSSKYIPVVGVDATAAALQAMKEGSMLGTVLNDAKLTRAKLLSILLPLLHRANRSTKKTLATNFMTLPAKSRQMDITFGLTT
jgi:ABC-type sugar transport system substrate-binding protein